MRRHLVAAFVAVLLALNLCGYFVPFCPVGEPGAPWRQGSPLPWYEATIAWDRLPDQNLATIDTGFGVWPVFWWPAHHANVESSFRPLHLAIDAALAASAVWILLAAGRMGGWGAHRACRESISPCATKEVERTRRSPQ